MKALIFLLISGSVVLAQAPPAKAPATSAATKSGAPVRSSGGGGSLMNPAALKATAPPIYRVKFETTHGDFVVEVHRDWAPLGADRFYNLVKNRFFTNNVFYRNVPNFIVQFGVPANPAVTKAWAHAQIKDDPVKESNKRGTIVFAMAGPNTRSTDFFINLKDNGTSLDGQGFAAFGTVTEGMDVVDGLYNGYGDMAEMGGHGPSQAKFQAEGNAYIDKGFPKLDRIKTATVIFPEAGAPASKSGAPAKSAAPGASKASTPASPPKKQ